VSRTARDHLRVAGGHGDPEDEFTPRELGLLAGVGWATVARPELVTQVAKGGLCPQEVMQAHVSAGMRDRLAEYDDAQAAEDAYWKGFAQGVRAFVAQNLARAAKNK
jgi:hypothetical protein